MPGINPTRLSDLSAYASERGAQAALDMPVRTFIRHHGLPKFLTREMLLVAAVVGAYTMADRLEHAPAEKLGRLLAPGQRVRI